MHVWMRRIADAVRARRRRRLRVARHHSEHPRRYVPSSDGGSFFDCDKVDGRRVGVRLERRERRVSDAQSPVNCWMSSFRIGREQALWDIG